jgi:hypothetical protein
MKKALPAKYKVMYQEIHGAWEKEYFLFYGVYPQVDYKPQPNGLLVSSNGLGGEPGEHKDGGTS